MGVATLLVKRFRRDQPPIPTGPITAMLLQRTISSICLKWTIEPLRVCTVIV